MFSEILWIAYDIFCGPKIEHYTTDEFKITNLKITVARSVWKTLVDLLAQSNNNCSSLVNA